jgi:uncharacterized protein (DUF1800 family)
LPLHPIPIQLAKGEKVPTFVTPTRVEAARFLSHASLGYTATDIEAVRQQGYEVWIDRQFAAWTQTGHWAWLSTYRQPSVVTSREYYDQASTSAWRRFIEGRDLLRQKMVFALSEIVIVSLSTEMAADQHWGGANHLDLLEKHAFGNYRDLLTDVSKSLLMGYFLTYRGSAKAGTQGVNKPDENYARELMQLFTIGLNKLELSGATVKIGDTPVPTYTQDDVATLARVFTGWQTASVSSGAAYEAWHLPMSNNPALFDDGLKSFSILPDGTRLMSDIPSGLSADENLRRALDGLMAHQNIAPFICRLLIQRLVTSNPSAAYLGRVAAVFNNNGQGIKGDMRAVIRAILLDVDLFDQNGHRTGGMSDETFGKLREPVARFVQWGKAFNVRSKSGKWLIGSSWPLNMMLGQRPLYAPSVFNFFRPGYVPVGTDIEAMRVEGQPMVAPEFQITNEVTVLDHLSAMQQFVEAGVSTYSDLIKDGITDVVADYAAWLPKVGDPVALVAELNTVLAAGQLGSATTQLISQAVGSIPFADDAGRTKRVKAAAFLVLASPEYIAQK